MRCMQGGRDLFPNRQSETKHGNSLNLLQFMSKNPQRHSRVLRDGGPCSTSREAAGMNNTIQQQADSRWPLHRILRQIIWNLWSCWAAAQGPALLSLGWVVL